MSARVAGPGLTAFCAHPATQMSSYFQAPLRAQAPLPAGLSCITISSRMPAHRLTSCCGRILPRSCATHEFGSPRRDIAAAMVEFIRSNPHLRAISSHTALLPVPQIDGIEIFPIIFVRHPIDRLRYGLTSPERKAESKPLTVPRLCKGMTSGDIWLHLLEPPRSRQAQEVAWNACRASPWVQPTPEIIGHARFKPSARCLL